MALMPMQTPQPMRRFSSVQRAARATPVAQNADGPHIVPRLLDARASDQEGPQVEEDCPEECGRWRGLMVIIATALLCLVPIVALLVSAFNAVPDSDPGDDGLASEGSQWMRAFTMGWLFCLALKLRKEFVGLAGASSFLEPW